MIFGKNKLKSVNIEKSVAAPLYPEKIALVTKYSTDAYTSYLTGDFTILHNEVSDFDLGRLLLEHLDKSKQDSTSYQLIGQFRDLLRKELGFTSEKQMMIDSKYVSVFMSSHEFRFEPYRNMWSDRGRKEFFRLPNVIFTCRLDVGLDKLGENLRIAWSKCI